MKKTLFIIALSMLSGLALAAGNHSHVHDATVHSAHGHHAHISPAGQPGDASQVTRTIILDMNDTMRFTPDDIQVNVGETIRFTVKNNGKIPHEMVIGSIEELKAHAAQMQKMPNMQHEEPNAITLDPGKQGDLVWKFTQAGTIDFACLIPGHFEAGMIGKVKVG